MVLLKTLMSQKFMGIFSEEFDEYFDVRFPKLLVEVYRVIYLQCSEEKYSKNTSNATLSKKSNATPYKKLFMFRFYLLFIVIYVCNCYMA